MRVSVLTTQPRVSHSCAISPSISCGRTLTRIAASKANKRTQDGITGTSYPSSDFNAFALEREVWFYHKKWGIAKLRFSTDGTTFDADDFGNIRKFSSFVKPSANVDPVKGVAAASEAIPSKGVILSPGWNSPMQGGTNTLEDLSRLFNTVAKPAVNLAPDPSIEVYEGVPYLMPFQQAIKPLGITNRPPSRNQITCPGFPRESFFYYAADGTFEGHFNRMYVVVDRADQVVSVQLVDETPKERPQYSGRNVNWSTYNFVNDRRKATSRLRIDHKLSTKTNSGWNVTRVEPNTKMFRVDSWLLSPKDKYGDRWDMKEQVRWYVPKPLIELILTCVQAGIR